MSRKVQARRTRPEVARSPWQGGLLLALSLLGLLALGGGSAWWLARPESLPLRTVRVQGELQHVSPQEVQAAVLPHAQAGFLHVDIDAVRTALEQLPWVHSVQVRRQWPDMLLVQLREQQVLARWGDDGLVNPEGKVFHPAETVITELPVLRGPHGTSVMVAAQFIELQRVLWPLQLNIAEVVMDERRAWRLRLDNGMELMLGRNEHPARMERFVRAWPRILRPRSTTIARIDLRHANGFAVSFRQS
ncbi:cell division protein FtsQ/DivIB [Sulfurivermis fontis]|uniref:cell division protein FtsQ/DivIB n=1 Tax=Sulfurivermis fontis TaxID=1972068 RepID=UPI0015583C65|nr:cell division protein FtsQ/DivIB [Sulfurivermis fontis]